MISLCFWLPHKTTQQDITIPNHPSPLMETPTPVKIQYWVGGNLVHHSIIVLLEVPYHPPSHLNRTSISTDRKSSKRMWGHTPISLSNVALLLEILFITSIRFWSSYTRVFPVMAPYIWYIQQWCPWNVILEFPELCGVDTSLVKNCTILNKILLLLFRPILIYAQ